MREGDHGRLDVRITLEQDGAYEHIEVVCEMPSAVFWQNCRPGHLLVAKILEVKDERKVSREPLPPPQKKWWKPW